MRTRTAPFPEAPPDAVQFTVPWQLSLTSGPTPLEDDVPAWDHQTVLRLSAAVDIDLDAVRTACHLTASAPLALVVAATSGNTKIRGPVTSVALEGAAVVTVPVEATLVGHELGGRLFLETMLVTLTGVAHDPLSPSMAGSIVWRHRQSTWLEGDGSRFPTEVADLSGPPFFCSGALWFLDLRTDDLDASALGSVRLILNETHPVMSKVLLGDENAEATAVMSAIQWDVARQLISVALADSDFVERAGQFEEDTLGSMLAGILSLHWPHETPRSLRQMRESEPGRFERELQDRAGLFRD